MEEILTQNRNVKKYEWLSQEGWLNRCHIGIT